MTNGLKDWREATEPAKRHWRAMKQGMALAYWAETEPDRPAVISSSGRLTFAELNARANQLARALRARGLVAGDAVALFCTNRAEFVETWAACLRAGFRLTPINSHLTADEASYILGDCGARAFIADAAIGGPAAQAVAQLDPDARGRVAARLWIDDEGATAPPPAGFEQYAAVRAAEDADDLDDPVPGTSMLYTSGTTGRPKGVHRDGQLPVVENAAGYRPGDLNLVTGPLYHGGPWVVSMHTPLAHGGGIVLMERWDAEEALRLIDEHRVTHTHMVPTMFHRLLALPDAVRTAYDVSSLRVVVHGAAPCPVHVKRAMIDWWGPIITEYYSATEGFGCIVTSEQWLERPGTVGRPEPGHIVIGDDDANPLPPGEPGLVWIRTMPDQRPFTYFGDDAKTTGSYRGEHFTLGDVGYLDDDGWLFLTDRSAHLIISGGVNVYPAEVDAVLLEHPAVADAAVIGVPDDEWGEAVLAVVELRSGGQPSDALAEELIAFCRDRLAHFKCPRRVTFVEGLPRTAAGKVQKHLLRAQHRSNAAASSS
jgi:long-chain acyl-CoA synthetase